MKINVCKTDETIQAIASLANKIWKTCYTEIITNDQASYMIEKFQSYDVIKRAIEKENYVYFCAYLDDLLVGYCGVQPQEERLFLSKLYVDPESQGKKVGLSLMREAIAYAKSQNLQAVYLTVNKENHRAVNMYQRAGFKTIDSVQTDIGHGYIMDDYIMELKLN